MAGRGQGFQCDEAGGGAAVGEGAGLDELEMVEPHLAVVVEGLVVVKVDVDVNARWRRFYRTTKTNIP